MSIDVVRDIQKLVEKTRVEGTRLPYAILVSSATYQELYRDMRDDRRFRNYEELGMEKPKYMQYVFHSVHLEVFTVPEDITPTLVYREELPHG